MKVTTNRRMPVLKKPQINLNKNKLHVPEPRKIGALAYYELYRLKSMFIKAKTVKYWHSFAFILPSLTP